MRLNVRCYSYSLGFLGFRVWYLYLHACLRVSQRSEEASCICYVLISLNRSTNNHHTVISTYVASISVVSICATETSMIAIGAAETTPIADAAMTRRWAWVCCIMSSASCKELQRAVTSGGGIYVNFVWRDGVCPDEISEAVNGCGLRSHSKIARTRCHTNHRVSLCIMDGARIY
jgi:hypothetical protein